MATPEEMNATADRLASIHARTDAASLRDRVANSLEDLYSCGRVWEAWQYGTMTADDFSLASQDEDVIQNVLDAVGSDIPFLLEQLVAAEAKIADVWDEAYAEARFDFQRDEFSTNPYRAAPELPSQRFDDLR